MSRFQSAKREREYEELKNRFQREGRYRGRAKEVAARIVQKQRKEYGETKEQQHKRRRGQTPDRSLPIKDYETLTIAEIRPKLDKLGPKQLQHIKNFERRHKNRKGVMQAIDRHL